MPDISMCLGYNCPKRDQCYRHMAVADECQTYADFSKHCLNNNFIEFIPIEGRKTREYME